MNAKAYGSKYEKHMHAAAIACIPFEFVCSDDQLAIITS